MTTTNARTEIEVLTREECLRLLAAEEVGRIAVVLGRQPLIMPVNYVLDGETIVLRTDPGTKLATGSLERVAFEVDHIDRERQAGWSVLVQGVGQRSRPRTVASLSGFERWRSRRGPPATRSTGCASCPSSSAVGGLGGQGHLARRPCRR